MKITSSLVLSLTWLSTLVYGVSVPQYVFEVVNVDIYIQRSRPTPKTKADTSRLDKIKSLYGWEGFVYDLEACLYPYLLRHN